MVEPMMYIAIGFLLAGLLVIGVIPLVHARAERLTTRRLEALTPLSMAEIQAEKDQLRAEFAMSTRRLEMSVEQLKAKTTSQLAEIAKKSDAIGRLKLELSEKSAAVFAVEAREKQVSEELQSCRDELAQKARVLSETEGARVKAEVELGQMKANLQESSVAGHSQRVELVALRAQVEALKGQIETFELQTRQLEERLRAKTTEAQGSTDELAQASDKAGELERRCAQLDGELAAQRAEAEVLSRRVEELQERLDEQGRFLVSQEAASDRPRHETAGAHEIEAEVRTALAEAEARHRAATESIRAENASLQEQLQKAREEQTALQREISAMKQQAENAWSDERMENALLRERINDVAAEVARLTAALEGASSPISSILNADAAPSAAAANGRNGDPVAVAPEAPQSRGTLADRIRALQSRARASQTGGS
jgi:chromosome segregation ATPase